MTTVTLPRRLNLPAIRRPAPRAAILGFLAAFVAGLLLLAGISLGVDVISRGAVLPRVSVGGVEIGGLDRASAERRLNASLPSLASGQATIVVGSGEAVVGYREIGRGYEVEAMVDAALAVGREEGPLDNGIARIRTLFVGAALPVKVHAFDVDAMDRAAAEVAELFSQPAVDAAVRRDGTTFSVQASTVGRSLDAADVRSVLAAAAATSDPANVRLEIEATRVPPKVSTGDARGAAEAARRMVGALELTVTGAAADEAPLTLTAETISPWISFGPAFDAPYVVRVDEEAVLAFVEALPQQVDREPSDAYFSVMFGGVGNVVPGVDGRALDVAATVEALKATVEERGRGGSVASLALPVTVVEPELTTAEAEAARFEMQMVSTWTTYYEPAEGNGWGANINIGAYDLDGLVLAPGQWFSFWDSIGPVVPERGYTYGGAIIGGRSVAGAAIGGGICSTSTTVFNAALRAGLQMGERWNHYYYIPRYPDGLDATVYQDGRVENDVTFRNDTNSPVMIRGYGGNGFVRFDIWMVPTDRRVVITDPIVSNWRAAIETTVVDSSLAPGTARRVEYPHDGHDVWRTRYVYDANGNLIHQNAYFSSYRTVNGITLVGPSS